MKYDIIFVYLKEDEVGIELIPKPQLCGDKKIMHHLEVGGTKHNRLCSYK